MIEIEEEQIGIVIEVKYAEQNKLDEACTEAMLQIDEMKYTKQLQMDGMETVLAYGVACYKKRCRIIVDRNI